MNQALATDELGLSGLSVALIRGMDLSTWVASAEATSWNNDNGDKNDNITKASMRRVGICRDPDGCAPKLEAALLSLSTLSKEVAHLAGHADAKRDNFDRTPSG